MTTDEQWGEVERRLDASDVTGALALARQLAPVTRVPWDAPLPEIMSRCLDRLAPLLKRIEERPADMTNEEQKTRLTEIYHSALDEAWEDVRAAMAEGVNAATARAVIPAREATQRCDELYAAGLQKAMTVLLRRLPEAVPQDHLSSAAHVYETMLRVDLRDVMDGRRPWWELTSQIRRRV